VFHLRVFPSGKARIVISEPGRTPQSFSRSPCRPGPQRVALRDVDQEVRPVRLQTALMGSADGPGRVSLRARLLVAAFRLTREKHTWTHPRRLDREIRRSQRPANARAPRWLRRRYAVESFEVDGHPCYTIRPRDGGGGRPHVLHLHGGAYVQQIASHHWRFLGRLIDRVGCTVTVPIYPLAPRHKAEETLAVVRAAHDRTLGREDPGVRVLMGDSAGAGLCLALAQQFRDGGHPQPARVIMISPWLDVTMTDPAVPQLDRRDPYLGAFGLADAGRRYAGDLDTRDTRISPLYGDLTGLGPLAVFIGTRDVLLADSRRFERAATGAGLPLAYHEYPEMIHNWPMRRLPEADRALAQLADLLRAASQPPAGPGGPSA
jgi:monoterpene epsilon-lactone hydrolase